MGVEPLRLAVKILLLLILFFELATFFDLQGWPLESFFSLYFLSRDIWLIVLISYILLRILIFLIQILIIGFFKIIHTLL